MVIAGWCYGMLSPKYCFGHLMRKKLGLVNLDFFKYVGFQV